MHGSLPAQEHVGTTPGRHPSPAALRQAVRGDLHHAASARLDAAAAGAAAQQGTGVAGPAGEACMQEASIMQASCAAVLSSRRRWTPKERSSVPSDDGGSACHCSLDTLVNMCCVTAVAVRTGAGQLRFPTQPGVRSCCAVRALSPALTPRCCGGPPLCSGGCSPATSSPSPQPPVRPAGLLQRGS